MDVNQTDNLQCFRIQSATGAAQTAEDLQNRAAIGSAERVAIKIEHLADLLDKYLSREDRMDFN